MKKTYTKPEIVFESFDLCTSIATGCELIIDNPSANQCGYPYEGGFGETMFTEAVGSAVCNLAVDDDKDNGFCYHIPIESNNLFNS